jgi:integrase
LVNKTSLAMACDWMLDGGHVGNSPNAKNVRSKLRYWRESKFANWSLASLHDWDLIEWRREVLDEDNADDGQTVGPDPEIGPQTVIHRLNTLSTLIETWSRAHQIGLINPVRAGVRPPRPDGRDRRLSDGEEALLLKAAEGSSRPWLKAAIIISIETCIRQGELAGLTWDRVILRSTYPHLDLPRTKNGRRRRVPLSKRAISAFKVLKPKNGPEFGSQKSILPIETTRGIIHAFRDAITDDKFPDLRWHDLRHEAISRLFELTDLRDHEIMAISGHLTPAMLARYTQLRAEKLVRRLPGGEDNPFTLRRRNRSKRPIAGSGKPPTETHSTI